MGNLSTPVATKSKSKRSKERIKSSTAAIYASVFALLVSVVAVGYRAPQEAGSVASSDRLLANAAVMVSGPSANDVTAAAVAASVASAADLAIAGNVNEFATSVQIQSQYASSEGSSVISKPAIVELSSASRNIATYVVEEGDTIESIANKFGISVNTIKWANDIAGDTVTVGKVLDVLPRSGIVYVAKSGDSVESIARKYKASASAITTFNDLEVSGLKQGLKIIIPDGVLPEAERPGHVAPVSSGWGTSGTFITGYSSGFSNGKTWHIRVGTPNKGAYAPGNCTAYVFDRRAELGRPIGVMWGNAGSWAMNAINAGYRVNKSPAPGAVIQDWGHVAIVERILPNGDLELSEMNAAVYGGGYNIVSGRILPASQISQYMYIH